MEITDVLDGFQTLDKPSKTAAETWQASGDTGFLWWADSSQQWLGLQAVVSEAEENIAIITMKC